MSPPKNLLIQDMYCSKRQFVWNVASIKKLLVASLFFFFFASVSPKRRIVVVAVDTSYSTVCWLRPCRHCLFQLKHQPKVQSYYFSYYCALCGNTATKRYNYCAYGKVYKVSIHFFISRRKLQKLPKGPPN